MPATKKTMDRPRLIRLIHVAKRDLGLDDDTYRALLAEECNGKASAAYLTLKELETVLARLKRGGFKVRSTRGDRAQAPDPQSSKIRALWLDLAAMGAVKNPSEAALGAFIKRMTGVDALQWLSAKQSSAVIEQLKKWQSRVMTMRAKQLDKVLGISTPFGLTETLRAMELHLDAAAAAIGKRINTGGMTEEEFQAVLAYHRGQKG